MGCSTASSCDGIADKSLNGTHRFEFTIAKDGDVWNTIDQAFLVLTDPSRDTVEYQMQTDDVATGIWYYDTIGPPDADLNAVGNWELTVRVEDGDINLTYPNPIGFRVR